MEKYGFLGFGNMARALVEGFIRGGKIEREQIYASERHDAHIREKCEKMGINPAFSNRELAAAADIVFICVPPKDTIRVTRDIKNQLKNKIVINIAPGIKFKDFTLEIPRSAQGMCMIPNMPVAVGEGIFLIQDEHNMDGENLRKILELLETAGEVLMVPLEEMCTSVSISSGGPAIVAMAIEAFADALVKHGLSRKQAYRLTAATFSGTANLIIETQMHPAELKDEVASPGGSTIQGITALEAHGFRNSIINALDHIAQCYDHRERIAEDE